MVLRVSVGLQGPHEHVKPSCQLSRTSFAHAHAQGVSASSDISRCWRGIRGLAMYNSNQLSWALKQNSCSLHQEGRGEREREGERAREREGRRRRRSRRSKEAEDMISSTSWKEKNRSLGRKDPDPDTRRLGHSASAPLNSKRPPKHDSESSTPLHSNHRWRR